jgi:tRNA G18 (ribose-2'-O)-methylase SpoU
MGIIGMKNKVNKLEIFLEIYRLTVLVTWDCKIEDVIKHCEKRGCKLTDQEKETIIKLSGRAQGICCNIGEGNSDVLVWMRNRPRTVSGYSVMYHELFHAVDNITNSHNMAGEYEARAFIYEFLTTQCNNHFWGKK